MAKKQPKYFVYCGDAHLCFGFSRSYRLGQLEEVFRQKVKPLQDEFFPGLVLRDDAGNLLKPELQVHLVPAEEDDDGSSYNNRSPG